MYVCVCERERECVFVCVRERNREKECVCVCHMFLSTCPATVTGVSTSAAVPPSSTPSHPPTSSVVTGYATSFAQFPGFMYPVPSLNMPLMMTDSSKKGQRSSPAVIVSCRISTCIYLHPLTINRHPYMYVHVCTCTCTCTCTYNVYCHSRLYYGLHDNNQGTCLHHDNMHASLSPSFLYYTILKFPLLFMYFLYMYI